MGAIVNADLSGRQMTLVRQTVAKDCNDGEFNLFMEAAKAYGLDPFRKQIMPLVFNKNDDKKRRMSIVVSRDGLRVIASRCQNYRPASEPAEIEYDPELKGPLNPKGILMARIFLWQQDNRGEWFKVVGEAYWDEFAPIGEKWAENEKGKWKPTGEKVLDSSGNWARMPVVMITKCAEAQALRAGWPDQFSNVYVQEELDRAQRIDLDASQMVAHEQEEARMRVVAGANAITITWGDGWALENVPVGQFYDRAMAFMRETAPAEIIRWADANREPLRLYWAKAPGDALELKKHLEAVREQAKQQALAAQKQAQQATQQAAI